MDNMRPANAKLPTVAVVCPRGSIREVPIATNINNLVTTADGKIQEQAAAEGWVLLEDAYRAEGFEAGWNVYLERQRAKASGMQCERLDDAWLPQLVHDRRARVTTGMPWKAPAPPKKRGTAAKTTNRPKASA